MMLFCEAAQIIITGSIQVTINIACSTNTLFIYYSCVGTGRVDIHRHPYATAACASGVVSKTTDRDSLRYTYNGIRRVRRLALGCESN